MKFKQIFCTFLCMIALFISVSASEKIIKVGLHFASTALSSATVSFSDAYFIGTYNENEGFTPLIQIPDSDVFCIKLDKNGNLSAVTYDNSSKSSAPNILKTCDKNESIFISYTNKKINTESEEEFEDPIALLLKEREEATGIKDNYQQKEIAGDTLTFSGTIPYAQISGKKYAGVIEFVKDENGKIKVINHISLERYIKGVLPNEVYTTWENEALKAAAVATRTFTLRSIRGKHANHGFDLCTTTDCQVYAGVTKVAQSTDNAVEQTHGQVLFYNNSLAETLYHAISGGVTESAAGAWGSSPESYPYLRVVETPFEKYEGLSRGSWQALVPVDEISASVRASSYTKGLSGNIDTISYATRTGYINNMTISDINGNTVTLKTSSAVRSVFGKYIYSSNFNIDRMYMPVNEHTSDLYVITATGTHSTDRGSSLSIITKDGIKKVKGAVPAYYIDGKGYGHGVGMSQYGAQHAALEGYTYDQILYTYYPGTVLTNFYE